MSQPSRLSDTFVSNGARQIIKVPYGVSEFTVTNQSVIINSGTTAFSFTWQFGMSPIGQPGGYSITDTQAPVYAPLAAGNGFTVIDPNIAVTFTPAPTSAAIATSAISAATSPAITTASTALLFPGAIVRLGETAVPAAQSSMNGIDWQVGVVTDGTHFTLQAVLPNAPTASNGVGFWRRVNNLPPWRKYYVANVTQAQTATVTFTTDHYFSPQVLGLNGNVVFSGDFITFVVVDPLNGMTELNNVGGYVLSVPATNQVVVGIDTRAFTAFAWPSQAAIATQGNYTPASASSQNFDIDLLYMILPGGTAAPGGANGNTMYWKCETSNNF